MIPLRALLALILVCLSPLPLLAQQPATMIVLDGSGSMWGAIDGRTKIEIARETLEAAVGAVSPEQELGLIVYGASRRGDCTDIVTAVPPGPAAGTAAQIIDRARRTNPIGRTPLTDAVRIAAETLRFTEERATVVLVTDGIETCEADPCALGAELERLGVDFTAHVVGFGLGAEEGRAVACLAENTGGLYIPATDAGTLRDALSRTLATPEPAPVAPPPPPVVQPRDVQLILRDVDGGTILNARDLSLTLISPEGAEQTPQLNYERVETARLPLMPGLWQVAVRRTASAGANTGYEVTRNVTVEPGDGTQVIDLALRGRLRVETLIHAGEPLPAGGSVPSAVAGSASANYALYALENGEILAEQPLARGTGGFNEVVPPGLYILRGTFARTITREQVVVVDPGRETVVPFDFHATRVYLTARDAQGQPVRRQTVSLTDRSDGDSFTRGNGGAGGEDEQRPFFLPPGDWQANIGAEGGGPRRSRLRISVDAPGQVLRLDVGEGETLSPDDIAALDSPDNPGCAAYLGIGHREGCLLAEGEAAIPAAEVPAAPRIPSKVRE